MKTRLILLSLAVLAAACTEDPTIPFRELEPEDAFTVAFPAPTEAITRLKLENPMVDFINAGNTMSLRLFKQLARETATSYVCSPFSMQVALAMLANGSEGETRDEILSAIGYGQEEGLSYMNRFVKALLTLVPALDLDVTFRMADALLVTNRYSLQTAFYNTMRDSYFAPAAAVPFNNGQYVMNLVNNWADHATDGLINPMIEGVDPNTVALLLNALYFKAQWKKEGNEPMFSPDATATGVFHRSASTETTVPYMTSTRVFQYADRGNYEIISLPYTAGQFCLFILLPKEVGGLYAMLDEVIATPWADVIPGDSERERIHLLLPKFDTSGDFNLNNALGGLGVHRIFDETQAQFGPMFDVSGHGFYVSRVLQKARLSLTEWGTEAGAVTSVEVTEKGYAPPKKTFKADHPFVFVLAGKDAIVPIFFGGVYAGV